MKTRKIDRAELATLLLHPGLEPWSDWIEEQLDCLEAEIVCIDEDVTIEGDLDAAWLEGLGQSCAILVIDGDLTVMRDVVTVHDPLGSLYNREPKALALIVRGDLTCRSLFCGRDRPVAIAGVARCAEVVMSHDDHSSMFFAHLEAQVVAVHNWNLEGDLAGVGVVSCEGYACVGADWPDMKNGTDADFFVDDVLTDYGHMDWHDVALRVRDGKPVFRVDAVSSPAQAGTLPAGTAAPTDDDWQAAYRAKLARDPADATAIASLAELMMKRGERVQLRELIDGVPDAAWGRSEGGIERAWVSLRAEDVAETTPPEDSTATTFRRAMLAAEAGRYAEAFELLLHVVATDREFGDDLGRIAMIRLFEVVGASSDLTNHWRSRMGAVMYV